MGVIKGGREGELKVRRVLTVLEGVLLTVLSKLIPFDMLVNSPMSVRQNDVVSRYAFGARIWSITRRDPLSMKKVAVKTGFSKTAVLESSTGRFDLRDRIFRGGSNRPSCPVATPPIG